MFDTKFVESVKEKTSMVELAKDYVPDLKNMGGGIWQGSCPHPDHEDSSPSFTVWEHKNTWNCMGCYSGKRDDITNFGTDSIAFIRWIEGTDFSETVKMLAKRANISIPKSKYKKIHADNLKTAKKYHKNLLGAPLDYILKEREINLDAIEAFLIGYDGERITFPLLDEYGHVLGFTRRAYGKSTGPKYKNSATSTVFQKRKYLYGIHLLDRSYKYIFITEGPTDVIAAAQNGVPNVVASLGTAFTEEHAEIIKKKRLIPVLCQDPDPPGERSAAAAYEELVNAGCTVYILDNAYSKDLDELSRFFKYDLLSFMEKNIKSYGDYLIDKELKKYEHALAQVRQKHFPLIRDAYGKIQTTEEKEMAHIKIKERTGLSIQRSEKYDLVLKL